MHSVKKAGTDQPMFTPQEFLTWQQIASFWSNKRQGAVMDNPTDSVTETHNDVYMSDPNLQVHDAVLDEITDEAMNLVTA